MNTSEFLMLGLAEAAKKQRENKQNMQTETIDKLFLELSQVTKAQTAKELKMKETLQFIKDSMTKISTAGHGTGYDWNADPENLTMVEGAIFSKIDSILYGP